MLRSSGAEESWRANQARRIRHAQNPPGLQAVNPEIKQFFAKQEPSWLFVQWDTHKLKGPFLMLEKAPRHGCGSKLKQQDQNRRFWSMFPTYQGNPFWELPGCCLCHSRIWTHSRIDSLAYPRGISLLPEPRAPQIQLHLGKKPSETQGQSGKLSTSPEQKQRKLQRETKTKVANQCLDQFKGNE